MSFKDFLSKKIKKKIEPSLNAAYVAKSYAQENHPSGNDLSTVKKGRETKAKTLENPYVAGAPGRREWNDRYFNMSNAIKQWQIAFYGMLGLVVIFAFLMVREANKVKVQPFVVEMNQGMPVAIQDMSEGDPNDKKIILFALEQFIVNARSIVSDETAEKAMLNKVYAYAADGTVSFLNDYYKENDPFQESNTHTTSIDIVNTLKVGDNTYQITWDESMRDANTGTMMGKARYIGEVTYKMGEVDKRFVKDNPFGLYVSQLSWSENKI